MNACTSSNLAYSKVLGDLASSYNNKLESGNLSLPSGIGKTPATEKKNIIKISRQANKHRKKNFFGGWGLISIFLDKSIINVNNA